MNSNIFWRGFYISNENVWHKPHCKNDEDEDRTKLIKQKQKKKDKEQNLPAFWYLQILLRHGNNIPNEWKMWMVHDKTQNARKKGGKTILWGTLKRSWKKYFNEKNTSIYLSFIENQLLLKEFNNVDRII